MGKIGFWYFGLTVYHILDFVCGWHCWYNFKDTNSDRYTKLTMACLCGTIFKSLFLYRFLNTLGRLCKPRGIGRINVARVPLPELNFNVLEALLNLFQSNLGGDIISFNIQTSGCLNPMNYSFACCCCCGAVMQLICFLKNLWDCQNKQVANLLGVIFSLVSLIVGIASIVDAQKMQIC